MKFATTLFMVLMLCSCTFISEVVWETFTTPDHAGNLLAELNFTSTSFDEVAENISESRDILYGFLANNERRKQVDAREKDLAKTRAEIDSLTAQIQRQSQEDSLARVDSLILKEKADEMAARMDSLQIKQERLRNLTLDAQSKHSKINKLKDDVIFKANSNGDIEKVRLGKDQGGQMKNVVWNMRLAALKNKSILSSCIKMIKSGGLMVKDATPKDTKLWRHIKGLRKAVDEDLPALKVKSEEQIATIKAFAEATNTIRQANEVPDPGNPKEEDSFIEVEEVF